MARPRVVGETEPVPELELDETALLLDQRFVCDFRNFKSKWDNFHPIIESKPKNPNLKPEKNTVFEADHGVDTKSI